MTDPGNMTEGWTPVGAGTPLHAWLETKRDGEAGTNVCMCRILCIGDEPEWIEWGERGRTTVTHHSFLSPTHWRWPAHQGAADAHVSRVRRERDELYGYVQGLLGLLQLVRTREDMPEAISEALNTSHRATDAADYLTQILPPTEATKGVSAHE